MRSYAVGYKQTSEAFTDISQKRNGNTAFNLVCGDITVAERTDFLGSVDGNIHCPLVLAAHCQRSVDVTKFFHMLFLFGDNGRSCINKSSYHTQFVLQWMVGGEIQILVGVSWLTIHLKA